MLRKASKLLVVLAALFQVHMDDILVINTDLQIKLGA